MTQSEQLFEQSQQLIPGGVNSPVRAFGGVGGTPVFFDHAKGPFLYDVDGNEYVDYVNTWGPNIAGHAHPEIIDAVKSAVDKGLSFGAATEMEYKMATKVTELMPSIEKVRMVNSGTEATMSAIRLARGFTGKNKFIKFAGNYHGHADCLLVKAGSGALTFGVPSSAGVPPGTTQDTLVADYNNLDSVKALFQQHGDDIAAIILEPIAGNMNFIKPVDGFLQGLRKLCDDYNSVLIFDEVMTGFRVALGGAQELYNIKPDLTTLGKVIGGGLPVGAYGGRSDIMDCISPLGPVYQAGTLSGNPIAMTAGLKNLELLSQSGFFEQLAKQAEHLTSGMQKIADEKGIPFTTDFAGGMFGLYFSEEKNIHSYEQVMQCDDTRFKKFFHGMLDQGHYFAPSSFEAGFITTAHSDAVVDRALESFKKVAL